MFQCFGASRGQVAVNYCALVALDPCWTSGTYAVIARSAGVLLSIEGTGRDYLCNGMKCGSMR